jgi:hypothetical protein
MSPLSFDVKRIYKIKYLQIGEKDVKRIYKIKYLQIGEKTGFDKNF